jgi:serine/threonine protein kinase
MTWRQFCPSADSEAIDLLRKLITFDPNDRLSALEVLQHPYLAEYYENATGVD